MIVKRPAKYAVVLSVAASFLVFAKFLAEPVLGLVMLVQCPVAECSYGETARAVIWGCTIAIIVIWSFVGLLWARRSPDDDGIDD